ncbi:MAG: hypothetical protein KAX15_00565, partial [Candidatus Omnitrophica bacterium]|nr:hypothetical protein [Candidatus Omnitrophota bacterium]
RLKEKIAVLERELRTGKKEYDTKLSSHQMVTEISYTAKETQLKEKIDLLEKDLAGFKKEADQETLSLSQRLNQKTEDLSLLEKKEHKLNNDLDKSDKELARAYETIAKLEQGIKLRKKKVSKAIRSAQEPQFRTIDALSEQIASLKEELEDNLDLKEREYKNKLKAIEKECEVKLKSQKDTVKTNIVVKEKLFEGKIEKLEKKLASQDRNYESQIKALIAQLNEKKAEVRSLNSDKKTLDNQLSQTNQKLTRLETTRQQAFVQGNQRISPRPKQKIKPEKIIEDKPAFDPQQLTVNREAYEQYYLKIRKIIFKNLKPVDFSAYKGKVSFVRFEFELFSNGSLKETPKFYGTKDETLKSILDKYFQKALPFPRFPAELRKASERFTVVISFEK